MEFLQEVKGPVFDKFSPIQILNFRKVQNLVKPLKTDCEKILKRKLRQQRSVI